MQGRIYCDRAALRETGDNDAAGLDTPLNLAVNQRLEQRRAIAYAIRVGPAGCVETEDVAVA